LDYLRDLEYWQHLDRLRDLAETQRWDELHDAATRLPFGGTGDRDGVQGATTANEQGRQPAPANELGDVLPVRLTAFEQLTDEQLDALDSSTATPVGVLPVLPAAFERLTDEQLEALDSSAARPIATPVDTYKGPTISQLPGESVGPGAASRYDMVGVSRDDIIRLVQHEELPSSASPLPAIPSDPLHEVRVQQVVNSFLKEGATRRRSATKFQILDDALGGLINLRADRQVPRSSESLILRDAERYLWGRVGAAVAQRMHGYSPVTAEIVGPQLAPFWEALKAVTRPINALGEALGAGPIVPTQIDPGKPQAAIGGGDWFELGLYHYWLLDRDSMDTAARPAPLDQAPRDVPGRALLDQLWYGK
jgi:hypothetical protein